MRDRGKIHRAPVLLGRFKTNLTRCRLGRFVQTVASLEPRAGPTSPEAVKSTCTSTSPSFFFAMPSSSVIGFRKERSPRGWYSLAGRVLYFSSSWGLHVKSALLHNAMTSTAGTAGRNAIAESALATTPRAPFAPPVPLPLPGRRAYPKRRLGRCWDCDSYSCWLAPH